MARMARMAHQQTFTFSHCQGTKATMMTTKLCKTSVSPDRLAPCFSFQKGSPESPLSFHPTWSITIPHDFCNANAWHHAGKGTAALTPLASKKKIHWPFLFRTKPAGVGDLDSASSKRELHIFSCMPLKHVLHFVSSQYLQPAARWFRQWYGWNVWIRKPCWKSRHTNTRVRSNTTLLNLFHWMQSLLSQRALK